MNAIGTSTIGSSEACMLGGLALKRRWKEAREKVDLPTDHPNLVMSSAVQVCWEKFCNYFDVEPRYVPISEDHKVLDGHDLDKYVDENTIGVVAIMGVTYTGMYEPVEQISEALDRIEERTGLDVRIHVDGASGGMIAPFIQPDLAWTSASSAFTPSAPPVTSTVWSTPVWDGSYGAKPLTCRKALFSR